MTHPHDQPEKEGEELTVNTWAPANDSLHRVLMTLPRDIPYSLVKLLPLSSDVDLVNERKLMSMRCVAAFHRVYKFDQTHGAAERKFAVRTYHLLDGSDIIIGAIITRTA